MVSCYDNLDQYRVISWFDGYLAEKAESTVRGDGAQGIGSGTLETATK